MINNKDKRNVHCCLVSVTAIVSPTSSPTLPIRIINLMELCSAGNFNFIYMGQVTQYNY